MGVRSGLTELFNFHLNEAPAYGAHIASDGHLTNDETWPTFDGQRVTAGENECYNECGFHTSEQPYAITMSNLKILQLRENWLYVAVHLDEERDVWEYTRLSLGKTVVTSPDAWVVLREFEDTFWVDDPSRTWDGKPRW